MNFKPIFAYIILLMMCFSLQNVNAQSKLSKFLKRTEEKITRKIDSVVDVKVDKTFEKIDDVVVGDEEEENPPFSSNEDAQSSPKDTYEEYQNYEESSPVSFERYSRFDFIPGNEVLFYDDFTTSSIGDIPQGWNFSGNTEIKNLSHFDGNWLQIAQGKNALVPPISALPENFTFEFDLVFDYDPSEFTYARYLYVLFSDHENPNSKLSSAEVGKNFFRFAYVGGANGRGLHYLKKATDASFNDKQQKEHPYTNAKANTKRGEIIKVSIWKTKNRMRVYLDEQKVFDVPRAFEEQVNLSTLKFWTEFSADNQYFFINNIRLAKSEASIQKNLSNNGVHSSQGIYFDTGSTAIKPESYATLKEIANYINNNGSSFLIVGHTDSDGDKEANRILSQQRSSAVREALVNEFGVDTNLLASGGFGSKYPIASNATSEGKAQNRRVDFVNLAVKGSMEYEDELLDLSASYKK